MRVLILLLAIVQILVQCQKIKHVVVLMEENRSFDHLFGYYPGVNGLTGNEYNPVNTSDPNSKRVYVDKTAPYIAPCDPDHGTYATTYKIFGNDAVLKKNFSVASMDGFYEYEIDHFKRDGCRVLSMFTPDKVPVISTLAREFAVFDRFFCAHAGPTWPNRMFFLSGTSAGSTATGVWYHDEVGKLFPQKTIFDQVAAAGLTWRNYYNDTPWELFMETIAHNPDNLRNLGEFFEDARTGNLPSFAFINPLSGINVTTGIGSNDMHPDHDVANGERLYKDIYEALRSSPQWNDTLFIITFDEHGGFYDHVSTPLNVPPPGDGEKSYPDQGIMFNRLGVRIPTIAISPWIAKGTVVSAPPAPQKPYADSEYDLTSILATTRKLLGINLPPLTKRDAWSGTFEHLISLSAPRTDCPVHLPDAPPVTPPSHSPAAPDSLSHIHEGERPLNDLQRDIMSVLAELSNVPVPDHVDKQKHVSDWNSVHLENHKIRTTNWKASKVEAAATYQVICQPAAAPNWKNSHWDINHVKGVPVMTVSTRDLTMEFDVPTVTATSKRTISSTAIPYCLDAGAIEAHTPVTISVCYPSADPTKNRDKAQQWVWANDATLRPFMNQTLCLTNYQNSGVPQVYIEPCAGKVEQHWAYHGPAPGDGGGGALYFGDDTNALGVISI